MVLYHKERHTNSTSRGVQWNQCHIYMAYLFAKVYIRVSVVMLSITSAIGMMPYSYQTVIIKFDLNLQRLEMGKWSIKSNKKH